jgi:hypothetical protein
MLTDMQQLIDKLKNVADDIARYLATQQNDDGSFPARDFYGKSFGMLLWSAYGDRYRSNIDRAIMAIADEPKVRKGPGKYHYEFNRFALAKMGISKKELNALFGGEHYAGTRVANWTLLRAWCRLATGNILSRVLAHIEIQVIWLWFRSRNGIIEDERGAFTSQYHAFCVALLGEAEQYVRGFCRNQVQEGILKGADALAELVLPGGQCNYMGRGSLQSFGYAAAILAFAHAFRISRDTKYLSLIYEIVGYLSNHQRGDGSIPLVLSVFGREEGPPGEVDQTSPSYAGWYTYNNFYDYLPFTGALIKLAQVILEGVTEHTINKPSRYVDENRAVAGRIASLGSDMKIIRTKSYVAVVSTPNRVWASSQPIPYLEAGKVYPLPCYGGEQSGPGSYSVADLPLPSFRIEGGEKTNSTFYCDPESYRWINENEMRGRWKGGEHHRIFIWKEASYEVVDRVTYIVEIEGLSNICCNIIRLPLPEQKVKIINENMLVVPPIHILVNGGWHKEKHEVFSPDGPLCVYSSAVVLRKGSEASAKHMVSVMER